MNHRNPMILVDGYKLDHRRQYPKGTTKVYSNWTPRGSRIKGQDKVVFFGLQYYLRRILMDDMKEFFFHRPIARVVDEYQKFLDTYLGPNDVGTEHIRDLHKLGFIPLEFHALPEGSLAPIRVCSFVVENTIPEFFWLTNYFETVNSAEVWMPCTSATNGHRSRLLLDRYAMETVGNIGFCQWQGHDFSFRGMAGTEAAKMSGAGHLLSFTGTDTCPSIPWLQEYYRAEGLIGGSVPATEHSVASCGGQENEREYFERMLDLYPKGIVSVVSDTWDLWNVLTVILPSLRDKIMARDGKLVIRPDSGDPVKIICGDPQATGPAAKGVIELLWDVFGGITNSKGYKELNSHIGCIYGDAITYERLEAILQGLKEKGFASTNMVFGIGSFTYQYQTRDTYGFAMKATYAEVNGDSRNLFKKPVTDSGEKFSATGRLAVTADWQLVNKATQEQEDTSLLEPVWKNGAFMRHWSLTEVRNTLGAIRE